MGWPETAFTENVAEPPTPTSRLCGWVWMVQLSRRRINGRPFFAEQVERRQGGQIFVVPAQ